VVPTLLPAGPGLKIESKAESVIGSAPTNDNQQAPNAPPPEKPHAEAAKANGPALSNANNAGQTQKAGDLFELGAKESKSRPITVAISLTCAPTVVYEE